MYFARNVVSVSKVAGRALIGSRGYGMGLATAPRNRVSFPEKVAHGIAIFLGFTATPAYILLNLKSYQK